MTNPPVLDLTKEFVEDYARLKTEYDALLSQPAPQTAKPAPDLEKRLAAALAEVAALKKSQVAEQAVVANTQAALARANTQIAEANRVVAGLRAEMNVAVLKGCPHCDQLREQLQSRQTELQVAKSGQQTLLDRIRQLEEAFDKTAPAADSGELFKLRKELKELRQAKAEWAELSMKYNSLKHKIETDHLKKLNP